VLPELWAQQKVQGARAESLLAHVVLPPVGVPAPPPVPLEHATVPDSLLGD